MSNEACCSIPAIKCDLCQQRRNRTLEAEAMLLFEATAIRLKLDSSVVRGSEPTEVKPHICTMPGLVLFLS